MDEEQLEALGYAAGDPDPLEGYHDTEDLGELEGTAGQEEGRTDD